MRRRRPRRSGAWTWPPRAEHDAAAVRLEPDRLIAEGRIFGPDGALEALLAAKRLRPADAATAAKHSGTR
jgi:hypothetical protein